MVNAKVQLMLMMAECHVWQYLVINVTPAVMLSICIWEDRKCPVGVQGQLDGQKPRGTEVRNDEVGYVEMLC